MADACFERSGEVAYRQVQVYVPACARWETGFNSCRDARSIHITPTVLAGIHAKSTRKVKKQGAAGKQYKMLN